MNTEPPNGHCDATRAAFLTENVRSYTLVVELEQDTSVVLRTLNALSVSQLRCSSIRYDRKGGNALLVIEVEAESFERLEVATRRIANIVGVSASVVLTRGH